MFYHHFVVILQNVMMNPLNGLAHFSTSREGTVAYVPGKYRIPYTRILLMDPDGNKDVLDLPSGRYQNPVFSPDGKELILTRLQEKANTWVYGLDRGTFRRFTEKDFESFWAIWTPDGQQIVYNSNRHGGNELNLFMKSEDGSDAIQRLTTSDFNQQPKSWSGDGFHQ